MVIQLTSWKTSLVTCSLKRWKKGLLKGGMIAHQMYSCPLLKNSEEIVVQSPPELFNYKYLRIV